MTEPMYWRIAQEFRQAIESGGLPPGHQLPTETELKEQYNASRNTIRDAIRWLTHRALVESRPGQGTFVAARPDIITTTLSADAETGLRRGARPAALSPVSEGRPARSDGTRVEVQRADDAVARELAVAAGTLVVSRHQARHLGGTRWSLQRTLYPMELVTRGAEEILQTGYVSSPAGPVPFRLTVSVFPADRNQFVIDFGDVPAVALARPGS